MIEPSQIIPSANPEVFFGPPVSMVYFGAWNTTYGYPDTWTYYTKFYNRYCSLYDVNGHEKGAGIDTIAIVESEISAMHNAGVSAIAFDTFLPSSIVGVSDPNEKYEWLQAGLEGYLLSSN